MKLHDTIERKGKTNLFKQYHVCAILDAENYIAYRISDYTRMKFMIEGSVASNIKEAYLSDTGIGYSLSLLATPKNLEYFDEYLKNLGFDTDFTRLCDEMVEIEKKEKARMASSPYSGASNIAIKSAKDTVTKVIKAVTNVKAKPLAKASFADDIDEDIDEDIIDGSLFVEEAAPAMYKILEQALFDYEDVEKVPQWVTEARELMAVITL